MMCSNGPPCCPGNTAESIRLPNSSVHRISPPRPPPIVLWIVVVTTSAYGTGLGCSPAATSPAKCAISTTRYAPTSSAIARNRTKSKNRGYADHPAMIIFGRRSCAIRCTSSMSIRPVSRST